MTMTVADLIAKLNTLPADAVVVISGEYGYPENARIDYFDEEHRVYVQSNGTDAD